MQTVTAHQGECQFTISHGVTVLSVCRNKHTTVSSTWIKHNSQMLRHAKYDAQQVHRLHMEKTVRKISGAKYYRPMLTFFSSCSSHRYCSSFLLMGWLKLKLVRWMVLNTPA